MRLQRKLRLLKTNKKSNSTCIANEIADIALKLKTQLRTDKQRYFGESLPNLITTSPERFWRYVRPNSGDCDVFDIESVQVDDAKKISEAFNYQFKRVFTIDDYIIPNFDAHFPPVPGVVVSEAGSLNMVLKLDVNKSPGPGDIPNAFLKRYVQWTSKYLCVLFTKSLFEWQIPDDWGMARVKPILKSERKNCVKNYRPISLTCTACKP